MPTLCMNGGCGVVLTDPTQGRFFNFEVVSISLSATDESAEEFDEKPNVDDAQFWLCERCCKRFSLVLEPTGGLRVIDQSRLMPPDDRAADKDEIRLSNRC